VLIQCVGKEERSLSVDMSDRQNKIVCSFETRSPRINAFHIHEWIYESLHLAEESIWMIPIDCPRRRVYIKYTNEDRMNASLEDTEGQLEFRRDYVEISQVSI
jgi:hypothetical protein